MPCPTATPAGRDPRNLRPSRSPLAQWVRSKVQGWTGQHLADARDTGDDVKAALAADLIAYLAGPSFDTCVNDALAVVNAR